MTPRNAPSVSLVSYIIPCNPTAGIYAQSNSDRQRRSSNNATSLSNTCCCCTASATSSSSSSSSTTTTPASSGKTTPSTTTSTTTWKTALSRKSPSSISLIQPLIAFSSSTENDTAISPLYITNSINNTTGTLKFRIKRLFNANKKLKLLTKSNHHHYHHHLHRTNQIQNSISTIVAINISKVAKTKLQKMKTTSLSQTTVKSKHLSPAALSSASASVASKVSSGRKRTITTTRSTSSSPLRQESTTRVTNTTQPAKTAQHQIRQSDQSESETLSQRESETYATQLHQSHKFRNAWVHTNVLVSPREGILGHDDPQLQTSFSKALQNGLSLDTANKALHSKPTSNLSSNSTSNSTNSSTFPTSNQPARRQTKSSGLAFTENKALDDQADSFANNISSIQIQKQQITQISKTLESESDTQYGSQHMAPGEKQIVMNHKFTSTPSLQDQSSADLDSKLFASLSTNHKTKKPHHHVRQQQNQHYDHDKSNDHDHDNDNDSNNDETSASGVDGGPQILHGKRPRLSQFQIASTKRHPGLSPAFEKDHTISWYFNALKSDSNLLSIEEEKRLGLLVYQLNTWIAKKQAREKKTLKQLSFQDWAQLAGYSPPNQQNTKRFYDSITACRQAKDKMILGNLRLVVNIAKKHVVPNGIPLADLIQEGSFGLITAINRYNPNKGFRFSTYATYWIRQSVLRALSQDSRLIRLPTTVHDKCVRIKRAEQHLTSLHGKQPTDQQLAHYLNLSLKSVRSLRKYTKPTVSMDALDYTDRRTYGETISGPQDAPAESIDRTIVKTNLDQLFDTLPPMEKQVVSYRYGFVDGHFYSQIETGKRLSLSRHYVKMAEQKALDLLRDKLHPELVKEYIDILSAK